MISNLLDEPIDSYPEAYLLIKEKMLNGVKSKTTYTSSNLKGLCFHNSLWGQGHVESSKGLLTLFRIYPNTRYVTHQRQEIFRQTTGISFNVYEDDIFEFYFETKDSVSPKVSGTINDLVSKNLLAPLIEDMRFEKTGDFFCNFKLLIEDETRKKEEKYILDSEEYYRDLCKSIFDIAKSTIQSYRFYNKISNRHKLMIMELFREIGLVKKSSFAKEITKIEEFLKERNTISFPKKSIDDAVKLIISQEKMIMTTHSNSSIKENTPEIRSILLSPFVTLRSPSSSG